MPPEPGDGDRLKALFGAFCHGRTQTDQQEPALTGIRRRLPERSLLIRGPRAISLRLEHQRQLGSVETSHLTGVCAAQHRLDRSAQQPEGTDKNDR
jgi:hypothetical protein